MVLDVDTLQKQLSQLGKYCSPLLHLSINIHRLFICFIQSLEKQEQNKTKFIDGRQTISKEKLSKIKIFGNLY